MGSFTYHSNTLVILSIIPALGAHDNAYCLHRPWPFISTIQYTMPMKAQPKPIPEPRSEQALMERAMALAGLSLGELSTDLGWEVPENLKRHKGWVGELLEAALGASAGSRPEPDFQAIGVELKTLPLDQRGLPRESTYVCTVPLEEACSERWEQAWVWKKLQRVMWVPVEAVAEQPISERRIGTPLLWSPSPEQEQQLRADWEEAMEQICMGQLEQLSAHQGQYLQVRPKAANARVLTQAIGAEGKPVLTNPRGFYLRSEFTAAILRQHFILPRS